MPHIPVTCPRCQSTYQVEPNLRGKFMRCPNAVCRAVFEVKDEQPPAPEPAPPASNAPAPVTRNQLSGSVGEIVPILSAEAVEPAAPLVNPAPDVAPLPNLARETPAFPQETNTSPATAPAAEPAWQTGPPPMRRTPSAKIDPPLAPAAELADDFLGQAPDEPAGSSGAVGVRELGPGTWEAPPVRRSASTDGSPAPPQDEPALAPEPTSPASAEPQAAVHRRRRTRWIIAGLLLLLGTGLALAVWLVQGTLRETEAERFQRAEKLYQDREFSEALVLLQGLHRDFPDSPNRSRYLFLAELCSVRDPVYYPQGGADELVQTLSRVLQFAQVYRNDPLLTAHESELWHTLYKLGRDLIAEADQKQDRALLEKAKRALAEARKFRTPEGGQAQDIVRRTTDALAAAEKTLGLARARRDLIERIKELPASADGVRQGRVLVAAAGLGDDAEFQGLLQDLVKAHIAGVRYVRVTDSAPPPPAPDPAPSLLVAPYLKKPGLETGPQRPTVFALVRGVLYAMDPVDGRIRWARRIGVDTTLLPLRLPASPIAPEVALVLSSDRKALSAVNAGTGDLVWERALSDPCLGQPVLVGNRILVPTYSGRVDEIELGGGKLLGYYQLGQPLTVGGARQEGTALVYFPADNFTVYVLDADARACAGVLYTGHPSGSLRSAPVVMRDPAAPSAPGSRQESGYLLLVQAEGLEAVKLRAFKLKVPIVDPDQRALEPELVLRGWSWFPPYHDGERLALASDAGLLGLYGIGQKGNRDPFLSPLLKTEVHVGAGSSVKGRALIVHADAENFWVLAHGRLHRLQMTSSPTRGPELQARWPEPPLLGSPLHSAQVEGESLFVVTQLTGRTTCLASAVDSATGQVRWQRQLGLVSRGQPQAIAGQADGSSVLVPDQNGVLLFDATKFAGKSSLQETDAVRVWSVGPEKSATVLLPEAGKAAALIMTVAGPETAPVLKLVPFQPGKERGASRTVTLPAPMAGTADRDGDSLILPLANGILLRIPLDEGSPTQGRNWRAVGAEDQALGHVVSLGGGDWLSTDGSTGITLLHWADPKVSEKKAHTKLPSRIIASPAVIPPPANGKATGKIRVCVADASDTVSLLAGDTLANIRSWSMPGKITAGPLVVGKGIICVVERNRLVWLDPDREKALWQYAFLSEVVGSPRLVNDRLVVANLAGRFEALDPATGRLVGSGYTLRANVAPTAAPVPFGPGRLFVPLSDGTILLLDVKDLN
jgi:outer membrane protein assembly factor BamB